ncbi:MAG: FGGY-family carbohydrate kinase, partial [Myxococcota bacterium]|nr:FGGY-family carbohydrate kinase [Myxococcota bacterium]
ALLGVTRGTGRGHVARAVLDGVACQIADLVDAMQADSGRPMVELRVDGAAAANDLLMQRQADLLGIPVLRPRMIETTSMGAAMLAGLAVGVWKGLDDLREAVAIERRFRPAIARDERAAAMDGWRRAVEAVRTMAKGTPT